jgi:hypothetical protein
MSPGDRFYPETWLGLGALVVATLVVVAAGVRLVAGRLGGTAVPAAVYVGIFGGAVAGVSMAIAMEWTTSIEETKRPLFRLVQWIHISYLIVGGGVYPVVMGTVLGLSPSAYVAVPGGVLAAVVWSEGLFLLAAVVYLVGGALPATLEWLDIWLDLFWYYLVYGVVLGVVFSLTEAVGLATLL